MIIREVFQIYGRQTHRRPAGRRNPRRPNLIPTSQLPCHQIALEGNLFRRENAFLINRTSLVAQFKGRLSLRAETYVFAASGPERPRGVRFVPSASYAQGALYGDPIAR